MTQREASPTEDLSPSPLSSLPRQEHHRPEEDEIPAEPKAEDVRRGLQLQQDGDEVLGLGDGAQAAELDDVTCSAAGEATTGEPSSILFLFSSITASS